MNDKVDDVEDYGLSELYGSSENENVEDERSEDSPNEQMANTDFINEEVSLS